MNTHPTDDPRPALLTLADPIVRAARLVLLLDERQPDALRAEAITMSPARLFWTLTQLDDGLPLEVCQALVRAIRLSRGRSPRPSHDDGERWSAETAASVAMAWVVRRLAMLPTTAEIGHWLGAAGSPGGSPTQAAPVLVADSAAWSWLDLPPLVGPPPGADDPSPVAWLRRRLLGLGRLCRLVGPAPDRTHSI